MNEQEVIALMKSSKSEAEWNANCDKVKKACGGLPALLVQRDRPLGRRRADRRQFRRIRRHQDQRHPVTRERSLRSKGLPASNCEVEPFSISIKF